MLTMKLVAEGCRAGYFMQPAVQRCVSADKFLDNSIQKQNPCAVSVAASFIPFLSLKQNLKNRKGMISCRVFAALELKEALWKA